jgi:hypothetical protein
MRTRSGSPASKNSTDMASQPALKFAYRNYRGEIEERIVDVDDRPFDRLQYYPRGGNDFHPEGGWMLSGICRDRKARRSFELKSIVGPIEEVV